MIVPPRRGSSASILILVCLLPLTLGCAHTGGAANSKAPLEGIGSILVIGFRPVILPDEQPGMVRNPLTDAIRYAEPVPQDVADKLTDGLFDHLNRSGGYHFISPRDARSQSSTIDSPFRIRGDFDLYLRIGESLSAEAFLAGYIWRWKDRKGAEFAVEFPASVDFDLYLIRLDDKAIVWKYEYDKTQQSLAENFLDLSTFLRAKGTWLSAFELAELGLEQLVEAFPKKSD
jgi:hypothetical protein